MIRIPDIGKGTTMKIQNNFTNSHSFGNFIVAPELDKKAGANSALRNAFSTGIADLMRTQNCDLYLALDKNKNIKPVFIMKNEGKNDEHDRDDKHSYKYPLLIGPTLAPGFAVGNITCANTYVAELDKATRHAMVLFTHENDTAAADTYKNMIELCKSASNQSEENQEEIVYKSIALAKNLEDTLDITI